MNEQVAKLDLDNFEENRPARAKIDGDRVINISSPLVPLIYSYGRSVVCDFSEARFGEGQQGRYPAVSTSSFRGNFRHRLGMNRWILAMLE